MTLPPWLRTAGALLLLATVVATLTARTWDHRVVPGEADPFREFGLVDFRDGIYYPTLAFVDGNIPYDAPTYLKKYPAAQNAPLYSPLMYLIHAPLALLSFDGAGLFYLMLCVVLTVALGATALHWSGIPLTAARVAGLGTLLLLSRPGLMHIALVNVTTVTAFLAYLAFWYALSRPALSISALAVSTFKGTYGLPIALLLWVRGDRRIVVVGLLLAALLTLPAVVRLTAGAGGITPIVQTLRATYDARLEVPAKRPENSPYRIDAIASIARTLGRSPTTLETLGIMAVILGAAGAALRRLRPHEDRARRLHATSLATFAIVAAFYHQAYDGLALTLPLVVLMTRPDLEPWRSHPGWRWAALALVAVPFLNYLGTPSGEQRFGTATLLAANSVSGFAILGALALYVGLAWRIPDRARHS